MNIRSTSLILLRSLFTFIGVIVISLSIRSQTFTVFSENGDKIELPAGLARDLISKPEEASIKISSWFASRGYLDALVENIEENEFKVIKGCLYEISGIVIEPEEWNSASLISKVPYSNEVIERYIQNVLRKFEEEGYPFAKVQIEKLTPDKESCSVDITLKADPGKRVQSSGIYFQGARVNSQDFLTKISGFRDSVWITSQFMASIRSNLMDSELFEEVGKAEIVSNEGDYILIYPVEERSMNHFNGLLGYVPDQNGNGQIVGDLELSLWNVLTDGNGIDLEYKRLRPETSRLNIGVRQDWIGSVPVGIGVNFRFYQNDTTYQTRNLNLNGYYKVSGGLRLTSRIGLTSSSSGKDSGIEIEPDGSKRYAELGFRYSNTNSFEVPTSGVRFGVSLGIARKDLDIDSVRAFDQQYVHANGGWFIPVSDKQVFAAGAHAYYLNSSRITISDLIELGGANSMRGYAEDQFRASKMAWADLEYRFMLNRTSYLFAFGAVGSYERPKLLTEPDETFVTRSMLYSTGFGISYKIRIGRLKFTYAVSPLESVGNGKVHLGITTRL